jgi:hypothetical protein
MVGQPPASMTGSTLSLSICPGMACIAGSIKPISLRMMVQRYPPPSPVFTPTLPLPQYGSAVDLPWRHLPLSLWWGRLG